MPNYYITQRGYGFWNFVLDCIMLLITGGLWGFWIIIREIRRSR